MQAVRAIFRKEIRELCRDKRAMFMMFALPLLVYPLLIIGIASVMMSVEQKADSDTYAIWLEGVDPAVAGRLFDASDEVSYRFEAADCADPETALAANEIAAILRVSGSEYTIEYNSASGASAKAEGFLREQLSLYARELTLARLDEAGLDAEHFLNPITVSAVDRASEEKAFGSVLGGIVPLLLIMGVFVGAMTPAMDVTAGEKERGTQETLMMFPVTGHELICGKYLAVACAGALSALLYMLTVGLIGSFMLGLMDAAGEGPTLELGAFIPALLVLIAAILAFALFLGAALMCVCTFAGSEKEASSYLSPIMVVVMLLSYLGFLDVHLTPTLAIGPVLNIVLLIKSVLIFEYDALAITLVLISNLAYAALAITVLGKLYVSERVLFGEKEGSLLERRSHVLPGSVPTAGDAVLTLLIAMVLCLYLGSLLQLKLLIVGAGLTQLLVIAVPFLAARYGRVDLRETFRLRAPNVPAVLAALILAVGAFFFCNMVCQPIARLAGDSAEIFSETFELLESGQSFWMIWLVVGLLPALCEEALFRGYLLSAFSKRMKPWLAIGLSSLCFAVYHMNFYQGCYVFLLGLILGYVVLRGGSIVYSCLIHFVCNSIAVLFSCFAEEIGAALPVLTLDTPLVNAVTLLFGAALTALGIFLFTVTTGKTN